MKKRVLITFICALLIVLSACVDNSSVESNEPLTETSILEGYDERDMQKMELQSDILAKESIELYSKLITKTYTEKDLFENHILYAFFHTPPSFASDYISNDEYVYQIECLRRISDYTIYAVYKTDEGGLAYRFFADDAYKRRYKGIYVLSHNIYVKKKISHSEFEKVKIGDSIERVEEIDPATELYKNELIDTESFSTIHLLTDGVMLVHYNKSGEDYKVSVIDYFDDFIISFDDHDTTYDCRIRQEDFI